VNWICSSFVRLRGLFRKEQLDRELDDELRSHLEMHIEENVRRGMTAGEARRNALIKLGGIEQTKESFRDHAGIPFLESLPQDLRFALRTLSKNRGFTATALITLSLGIGANTAIFSFADLLLNYPVSLQHLERLVSVEVNKTGSEPVPLSAADFHDLRAATKSFKSFAGYQEFSAGLAGKNQVEEIKGVRVDEDFFTTLEATPMEGRTFLPEEYRPGKNHVVVLNYGFWKGAFGGDNRVTDKKLRIDNENYDIVGVMPESFQFPPGGQQFWVPLALSIGQEQDRTNRAFAVVGRLKAETNLPRARAEMKTAWSALQEQHPETNRPWELSVLSLRDHLVDEDSRKFVILLQCVAGFVLLIACVNVANLELALAAGRRREIAIRAALGAGRSRLIRQLLTQSMVVAVLGGAVGLLFALWGVALMRANMPGQVREICDLAGMRVNLRAFMFTLFAATASGLLSGIVPAFRITRLNLRAWLETGGARTTGDGQRLRNVFVISEVILAVVLLTGAGLMVKGFYALAAHQTAMEPQTVLTFHVNLWPERYASLQQRQAFHEQLLDRLRTIPGVEGASAASGLPYSFYENDQSVIGDERIDTPGAEMPTAMEESIGGDYFRVMRIPLRAGRFFDQRDGAGAAAVGIVSESMARRFWPGQEAVGHRLKLANNSPADEWITIVGVTADVRHEVYDRTFRSVLYRPLAQVPDGSIDFAVRTSVEPSRVIAMVRSAAGEVDRDQPIALLQTMAEKISEQTSALQFVARLMGIFGLVAILLSAAGIYGVITHSVTERRREIGIRAALGARRSQVLRMVLRQGLSLVAVGGAIGISLSLILARLLSSLLYGVQAWDITVYSTVPILLVLLTLAATLIPAVRAASLPPMVALRYE
jgi:putative ABC transport system permease protein